MRQCTLGSRINEKVKKEGQNGNEEIELIDLTMGRGSDRLPSNLFHLGSDHLLSHKGRSVLQWYGDSPSGGR